MIDLKATAKTLRVVLSNLPTFLSLVRDIAACPVCVGDDYCQRHEADTWFFSETGRRLPDDVEVAEFKITKAEDHD